MPLLVGCGGDQEFPPLLAPAAREAAPAAMAGTDPAGAGLSFALVVGDRLLLPAPVTEDWADGPVELAGGPAALGETVLSRIVGPHKLPVELRDLGGQTVQIFEGTRPICTATVGALRIYRGFSGMPGLSEEDLDNSLGHDKHTTVRAERDGTWRLTWTAGARRSERRLAEGELWSAGEQGQLLGAELVLSTECAAHPAAPGGTPAQRWARATALSPAGAGTPGDADPQLAGLAIAAQRSLPLHEEHRREYEAWRVRAPADRDMSLLPRARSWDELGQGPSIRQTTLATPAGPRTLLLVTTRASEGEDGVCGDRFYAHVFTLWEVLPGADGQQRLVLRGQGDELQDEVQIIDVDGELRLLVPGDHGPAVMTRGDDGTYETTLHLDPHDYDYLFVCPC